MQAAADLSARTNRDLGYLTSQLTRAAEQGLIRASETGWVIVRSCGARGLPLCGREAASPGRRSAPVGQESWRGPRGGLRVAADRPGAWPRGAAPDPMSAVTQRVPPRVEVKGFKMYHPEGG